jgi:D-3-phosphoglycerate dehydrogenase / 2-oxoglutarate reductase
VSARVLALDPTYPVERVRAVLADVELGSLEDAGPGTQALLVSPDAPVRAADIRRLPDLRVISSASTGTDHIDVAAAEAAGVAVRRIDDYCTEEVADHAVTLLAMMRRGLPEALASVRRGEWDFRAGGTPRRLAGTRLAVVGYGRIGRALADRARGLGMEVRFHDPFVEGGEPDLDALLAWAEAVSLHSPLTEDTRGLVDARRLALLRDGCILVNTARAPVVDRDALVAATHVRAAFDHLWEHPPGEDLLALPHLTITPYMAWFSDHTEWLPYELAARAAAEVLAAP